MGCRPFASVSTDRPRHDLGCHLQEAERDLLGREGEGEVGVCHGHDAGRLEIHGEEAVAPEEHRAAACRDAGQSAEPGKDAGGEGISNERNRVMACVSSHGGSLVVAYLG